MTFVEKHETEADQFRELIGVTSDNGLRAAKRIMDEAIESRAAAPRPVTRVMPEAWYQRLDAGIRFPVRVLHAAGLETCQSCQGGPGHDYPMPAVDLPAGGSDADGLHAVAALASYGLDVLSVSIRWGVTRWLPCDRVWRVELRCAYPERANEQPIFVCSTIPHT